MFAYLSKKIGIPNNSSIRSVAWSMESGFVAVGGEYYIQFIIFIYYFHLEGHRMEFVKDYSKY